MCACACVLVCVCVCVCVCVSCLQTCVFVCQLFCVPPILANYIQTGRVKSLEGHKSLLQNTRRYISITLSILRIDSQAFRKTPLKSTSGEIFHKYSSPQRLSFCHPGESGQITRTVFSNIRLTRLRKLLP